MDGFFVAKIKKLSNKIIGQEDKKKEEGEKMQSPDEKHQEINDKYSNNLTPIDELP